MGRVTYMAGVVLLCGCVSTPQGYEAEYDPQFSPYTMTDEQVRSVQSLVSAQLKDPGSAQFGDMYAAQAPDGDIAVCGIVNARNGFGGYVGNQPFVGRFDGNTFEIFALGGTEGQTRAAVRGCKRIGAQI